MGGRPLRRVHPAGPHPIATLLIEQPRPPAFRRDLGPLTLDLRPTSAREIVQRLPSDRRVAGKQPLNRVARPAGLLNRSLSLGRAHARSYRLTPCASIWYY